MSGADTLDLCVTAMRAEARDVVSIELREVHGRPLPAFAPGAHLELTVPTGEGNDTDASVIRHYSLCNDARETDRYLIAVSRTDKSRGGSIAMHEHVRRGTRLAVRALRNSFPLVTDAGSYLFIAGGIGVTPILSMIRWCAANGRAWQLLYATRSRPRTAFYEELAEFGERVRFHFDDEAGGRPPDVESMLGIAAPDRHVYCCGPRPMMQAVDSATQHWPASSVHFEWFSGDNAPVARTGPSVNTPFEIVLRTSGRRLCVPPDLSILETLEANGVSVPFACREGLCRTCETPLINGEAEHRDVVMSAEEQQAQRSLMVCVSRAKSAVLELDL